MLAAAVQNSCAKETKGAEVARLNSVQVLERVFRLSSAFPRELSRAASIIAICALGSRASLVGAQVPAASDSARTALSNRNVAVVIYAEASAREIRFSAQPEVHVRLTGELDSLHVL